ncbi:uncharacterized protein NECHADRAFT_83449 [Fusarium vanettenii 77-13-4]|uniref:Uncharacterized protein n=1 Tax=Fusarium vanettenii (strain ATCC MYA-4622 / CBS 123669 / FGSC 9596 / NRRL 45880 / 77-13-4) TaxID=660122 RepID=C7Z419_FUSV7|nr:uncharacterized protein NECHADRAFT_83449 [Fusarium vanettenii 77-13-4]EEU41403.1 predicted protein [Fusarium vanettenii 77-13-4]
MDVDVDVDGWTQELSVAGSFGLLALTWRLPSLALPGKQWMCLSGMFPSKQQMMRKAEPPALTVNGLRGQIEAVKLRSNEALFKILASQFLRTMSHCSLPSMDPSKQVTCCLLTAAESKSLLLRIPQSRGVIIMLAAGKRNWRDKGSHWLRWDAGTCENP